MASYLRPRRGKQATAESQAIVLKRGEVFFEVPTGGVGTGIGKIKMGDGTTAYSSLPYFLNQLDLDDDDTKIGFTNTTTADTDPYSTNPTYLTNIAPTNSVKTIFTNLKHLLFNYNSQLTTLNNDLTVSDSDHIRFGIDSNGNYGYKKVGADTVTPFKNPTGTLTLSSPTSGTDCTDYASVKTSGLIVTPTATLTLSAATSGTDCTNYAKVVTSGLVKPSGNLTLSSPTSGTDCSGYSTVSTSGLVKPSGNLTLYNPTSGTDCSGYSTVSTSGMVTPSGTGSITSNGTVDVHTWYYASVNVLTSYSQGSALTSYTSNISISNASVGSVYVLMSVNGTPTLSGAYVVFMFGASGYGGIWHRFYLIKATSTYISCGPAYCQLFSCSY